MKKAIGLLGIAMLIASLIYLVDAKYYRLFPEARRTNRLHRALLEPDDEILWYVAEKLGRSGTRSSTDALLSALKNIHPIYRSDIATGLGFVKDKRATPALLQALREGDPQLQHSAALALARCHDPAAIEPLLLLMRDPSATTRRNTIYALRMMKDARAFDALCNALKDTDEEVRAAAVRGIALSRDTRAVELLYSALSDNTVVSTRAAEALSSMPDDSGITALIKAYKKVDFSLYLARSSRTLNVSSEKREVLISFLLNSLKSALPALRARAAEDLVWFEDPRILDALIQATADSDFKVRWGAARSLSRLHDSRADAFFLAHAKNRASSLHQMAAQAVCDRKDPRNLLLIVDFLKERNEHIQFIAAMALSSMADPHAIPALTEVARTSNKGYIQNHIRTALGISLAKAGDPRAIEVLRSIIEMGEQLSDEAVAALAGMDDQRAREILVKEYDRNPQRRSLWIQILGKSNNFSFIGILIAGLKDKDLHVRRASAEALNMLQDPAATDPLIACLNDPETSVRIPAMKALAKMRSQKAVPALIRAMDSPACGDEAATALGQIGDKRAAAPLRAILQNPPSACPPCYPNKFLRAAAAEALGQVGDHQSIPVLLKALKEISPRVSRGAAKALGTLKDRRALYPLIEALGYEHCSVRESAARSLGEIGDPRAIPGLAGHLSDCAISPAVANVLSKLQWQPRTNREKTYNRLAQQKRDEISAEWPISRAILSGDIKAKDSETVQGAAFALIAIGSEDMLPELADALKNRGTYGMATGYYNSGQPQLQMAAIQWAFDNGLDFLELQSDAPSLLWGGRNLSGAACPLEFN